jgi:D-alanyl-lipoteichoic acid acyltransferase DltB (MBOAT superfamily)
MLFNSFDFGIFLVIVFFLYWFVFNKNYKYQNLLIVIAIYIFYGWWDWRFLSLILFSTIVDYLVGIGLYKAENKHKRNLLLATSITINLGLLIYFKYYNFFIENFVTVFRFFGHEISPNNLNIILPVGISFYTFQTLSYTFDSYRRHLIPTFNFVTFAAYVSFFPQLVAGPIERATNLLPQINAARKFDYTQAIQGTHQILWGLFKKVVIADNCAPIVNEVFASDFSTLSGSTLLSGVTLFTIQIYGDFSGYSDIAIGTSKLFGIKLMTNFRFPFFARSIAEYWTRWHISLSTWFRDYIYIPLGGSKFSNAITIRNVFVVFLVSGFWHGANWTYIIWGGLHTLFFLPALFIKSIKETQKTPIFISLSKQGMRNLFNIILTFFLVVFGFIFFRSQSVSNAFKFIAATFNKTLFTIPKFRGDKNSDFIIIIVFIIVLFTVEWKNRNNDFVFEKLIEKSLAKQLLVIISIVTVMYYFTGSAQDFIYFQF